MKQTTKKRVTSVLAIAMTVLLAFPLGSAHVEARLMSSAAAGARADLIYLFIVVNRLSY